MSLEEKLPGVQENVSLAPLTTLRIGGGTRYLYLAKSEKEILKVVTVAGENQLPFFILGGGSNLLVSDNGFSGLVMKIQSSKIEIKGEKVKAESGAVLGMVVNRSIEAGLTGLEWAVGIPGTVGGAVCGNAGAFGHHLSESVEKVEVMDERNQTKNLPKEDCHFGYRESVFKRQSGVILGVILKLKKGNREKSRKISQAYLARRRVPPYPSAGSVFKNIKATDLPPVAKKAIPKEKIKGGMVSTGYLIDRCGLRGRQIRGARIAEEHANFIVNLGEAKARDVVELISLVKEKVKDEFGIELKEEIRYLGF